jgi:membrane fusion protein, multidrug efflux system
MSDETPRRRAGGTLGALLLGVIVVGGAAFGAYTLSEHKDAQLLASRQALAEGVARGPRVQTVSVSEGPKERLITLLGDTRAMQTAILYSKVGGYLKSISVDRGDMVQAGQVIAEIDSAETDSQYNSAVTDLINKVRNAKRARELVASGARSVQAIEQAETDARMAQAKVDELSTMKSYETIRAPFDGRVTARFVDPGALVQSATTNQTSNQPIVTLMDDRWVRIDIYVEQSDVPYVHVGDMAEVSDAANAGRKVSARIARTSGQLDPRTRTLFVELEVDNTDRFLLPGAFAYVTLHVPLQGYPEIPANALVVRGTNTFVAGVGEDNLVKLRRVKVASTDGMRVGLAEGARVGERIAINLPDDVSDGGKVQPIALNR